jgi:antitoxin CptB
MRAQEVTDSAHSDGYISIPGTSGLFALEKATDMTGTKRSSDGLDDRRKRLLFRCWHRGTREMDMILGGFADAHIAALSDAEMSDLEVLMELPDPDLYAAFSGAQPLESPYEDGIFIRIKQFLDASRHP